MQHSLPIFVIISYLAAGYAFHRTATRKTHISIPLILLFISSQSHISLLFRAISTGAQAVNMSVFNVVSLTGWAVACVSFFWLWRKEMALSGAMICFINALLVISEVLFPSQKTMSYSAGMLSHIAMAISSWTVLSVALIHGGLYLFLFHRLKRKKIINQASISLSQLERLTANYLLLGTILLVVSIILGCVFVGENNSQLLWIKMPFTIIAAAFYIYAFYSYMMGKKRGIALIYFSFYAYLLLMVGYVFSNILQQFFK
ncbi:MAG: hypothetical protein IJ566_06060 [Cardiobacteriaceae bacterium]|nr:hypothetical protein [Cardiobacteriaceae bacterium]